MSLYMNSVTVSPTVYGAKKNETQPAKQSATAAQNQASAPSEGFWDYFTEGLAGLLLSPWGCGRSSLIPAPQGQNPVQTIKPKDAGGPDPIPNPTATSVEVSAESSVKDAFPAGIPDAFISLDATVLADQIVFGAKDAQSDLAGRPDLLGQSDLIGQPDLIGRPDLAGPDSVAAPDLLADLVPADKCHPANGILTNLFDRSLLAAIRRSLGKADTDEITTDDALKATKLDISFAGVSRLDGIECFENLEVLSASFNSLSDFSPLSGTKKVFQLDLNACNISDLSSLPLLPSLNTLFLVENQITDLAPLAKYPMLNVLGVSFNNITDLSPIASLPKLTVLYALNLPLPDLSPLKSLANAIYLDFRNDPISDISPLIENPNVGKHTEVHLEGITAIPPEQITALKNKGANVCQ